MSGFNKKPFLGIHDSLIYFCTRNIRIDEKYGNLDPARAG